MAAPWEREHPIALQLAAGIPLTREQRDAICLAVPGRARTHIVRTSELPTDAELWQRFVEAADAKHDALSFRVGVLSAALRRTLAKLDPSLESAERVNLDVSDRGYEKAYGALVDSLIEHIDAVWRELDRLEAESIRIRWDAGENVAAIAEQVGCTQLRCREVLAGAARDGELTRSYVMASR